VCIYDEDINQTDAYLGALQHNVQKYQKVLSNKEEYNAYD